MSDNREYLKDSICNYLAIQAIISTVLNIGTIILMRERPKTPPSVAAENAQNMDGKLDMKKDIKLLLNNKNFFVVGGAFVCCFSL